LNLILFEFHTGTSTEAESSPSQCILNIAGGNLNSGGHSFDDRNKLRAMRFSSG
jgi:hypothetical protein